MDGLAALVKEELRGDPFSGAIFVFRAKRADRIKIVAWDGSGLVLFWKRLEHGAFRWRPITDDVIKLSSAQLAALIDGMDWSRLHARDVVPPTATSRALRRIESARSLRITTPIESAYPPARQPPRYAAPALLRL